MKIGILNDTHLGLTQKDVLAVWFQYLADLKPDVIVHAGDWCGGTIGHIAVEETCQMLRQVYDGPILAVIGNHDWWCGDPSTLVNFTKNYQAILAAFEKHHVHFFDEDGPFVLNDVLFIGASGWYHQRLDSNDYFWMPRNLEGDTFYYMQHRANRVLEKTLAQLDLTFATKVFVSHFPVLDCNPWDGNPRVGEHLEALGFQYFISGHSHSKQSGPKHFRTGTDYYLPESMVITI